MSEKNWRTVTIIILLLSSMLFVACRQKPAPRPTYVPTPYPPQRILANYAYPLICFEPPVVGQFHFGRGGGIVYTTNTTNGCGTAWGVVGEGYWIWAEQDGYEPVAYEFTMSHAKEVIHVSSLGTPTTPPTIPPTGTATHTVTPTQTPVQTVPIATATPWASLPARYAVAISRLAQERLGVDWQADRSIWDEMSNGVEGGGNSAPLSYVLQTTIEGETFRWTVGTDALLYIYARGRVYEEILWLYVPTEEPVPTETSTSPPAPTHTPRPTIPPVPSPTITKTGQPTIPPEPQGMPLPIIYKMFDYGTDYQSEHPEYGPIGSGQWVDPERCNPAPGVYNWDALEANLSKEEGLKVTLWDGTEQPKPVAHYGLIAYLSNTYEGRDFDVLQPPFWPAPYLLVKGDKMALIPPYDNSEWREYNYALMRAFGARYNNDPRIGAVQIMAGLDGECQPTKDWSAKWKTEVMDEQRPGLRYAFNDYIYEMMRVTKEAFPTKPLFIANAPKDLRETTSDLAVELGIGIKHAGMWVDSDSEMGYGSFWPGSWDKVREYSQTVPIWLESPFDNGNMEHRYWAYLHGLHYHPDLITVHPSFLTTVPPEITRWVGQHIGVTITDTPSVFTVLREEEFPYQSWGDGAVSGFTGDWTFWLYRDGDAPRVEDIDDTIYGRQARRITEPVHFRAAPGFEIGRAEITVKSLGQTIIVDGEPIINMENDGAWRVVEFPAGNEFEIEDAGYTHLVEAFREPKKSWTVMIYMAGDNNLLYYFERALRKLEQQTLDNVHLIVFLDGSYEKAAYYIEPYAGETYTDLVNSWDLGEVNTGDPATLEAFVTWAHKRYPSEYTYLAVADHGRGTHGIAYDDTSYKDSLSPAELRTALLGATGGEWKIDVLHADACLMGMVENGYQMRDVADYYVAYENLGWSVFAYEKYAALANGGVPPRELAQGVAIVYHNHTSLKGKPRTSSAVDLSKLDGVMRSLDNLVAQLKVTDRETVLLGRKWAQRFDTLDYGYLTPADEYIDLYDFAVEIFRRATDEMLKEACRDMMAALDEYVIENHSGSGQMCWPGGCAVVDFRDAKGAAIYFPQNSSALEFDEYTAGSLFEFTNASEWDEFLAAFYMGSEVTRGIIIEPRDPPPMLEVD